MKHTIITLFLFLVSANAGAIETRTLNYRAVDGRLVCMNGTNRYTRALYGGPTAFRLETSDRPVFALYEKGKCRNVSFRLLSGKEILPMDSAIFACEAHYEGGRRDYTLRLGNLRIDIAVLACYGEEAAVWRFVTSGARRGAAIEGRVCMTRGSKFKRNGDLGIDDLSLFEASEHFDSLRTVRFAARDTAYVKATKLGEIGVFSRFEGKKAFECEEKARLAVVSRLRFATPDPLLNALGGILMHAADGLWDGQTWQHGCIGWRMPLAGWRGCYVGDAVGWTERSYRHFISYAHSQVRNIPPREAHPTQDTAQNLARAVKRWGTQMYSDGYICRYPERANVMHHYDMNLNYIDGLLHHLQYDADTLQLREFWPVLKLHLEWEKRNFDPDNDHLYDAYCCIWASDALYYSGGAVTHSSAYNYRHNLLAARIAELLGEDATPYKAEADAILRAMNARLWLPEAGHWAEHQDLMGLKRVHPAAALWSIYTPIDCGACSPRQAWRATEYVDSEIPHIFYRAKNGDSIDTLHTLATSSWMPYAWSTNNVAHEEVANMALAYFQAGRGEEGLRLLRGDLTDEMLAGQSPGNFGQISHFDKVVKEAYRDFGDNVGITSRALINGLFGIQPEALYGRCVIKPSFPADWREASVETPYLSYKFTRSGTHDRYEIRQHFARPLQIVVSSQAGGGMWQETIGTCDSVQVITIDRGQLASMTNDIDNSRGLAAHAPKQEKKNSRGLAAHAPELDRVSDAAYMSRMGLDEIGKNCTSKLIPLNIDRHFNASVTDIFKHKYLSPRPPYTTLQIPVQGIGQWCHPDQTAEIDDSGLRACVGDDGLWDTGLGVSFRTPRLAEKNIVFSSLWDNYPDTVEIGDFGTLPPCSAAYLMLAGTTNNMQSRIDNALVIMSYTDGTADTLRLVNPINWPTINEAYNYDDDAFWGAPLKPLRFRFDNGRVGRDINSPELLPANLATPTAATVRGSDVGLTTEREIHHGAGVILRMPLNATKRPSRLRLVTLSNDVVIGLMGITLQSR